MKKWVNAPAPMYDHDGEKLTVLPERAIVEADGWSEKFAVGYLAIEREMVTYRTASRTYAGFVYVGFLEGYIENLPKNCVQIGSATADPNDAEQYALIHGVRQVNLCGELCAAYLLGVSLEDVLAEWQRAEPKMYQSVFNLFSSKQARGTGAAEVQSMLSAFDRYSVSLASVLTDPVLAKARYTVSGLKAIAGRAVVSVRMDKWTGRLKPSGVLHWVVVTDVIPERTGYGGVEVYNPFPNRIEAYSWSEFVASAGVPYGVVMSKEN